MMRTPFIARNWKMYKTVDEAVKYVKEFRVLAKDVDGVEIVAGSAVHGSLLRRRGRAQQQRRHRRAGLFWEREGAYTGEVSGAMLREAGVEYVIVGHSERRTLFGETDVTVNRKIAAAFAARLCADCLHRRNARAARAHRKRSTCSIARSRRARWAQLRARRAARDRIRAGVGDRHRPERDAGAGGRGARPYPEAAAPVVRSEAAELCHVIYGGSVKPDNIADLASQPDVDGALVGGASLDVRAFSRSSSQPAVRARSGAGGRPGLYNRVFSRQVYSMLYYLAAVLYVLVCFVLMMVILLQQGKGGDIANAFGGGSSQAAFGARSGATVLTRATTVLAVLFLVGALVLEHARRSADRGRSSAGARR